MNDELWQREVRVRKRDDDGAVARTSLRWRHGRRAAHAARDPHQEATDVQGHPARIPAIPMEFVVEILKVVFHYSTPRRPGSALHASERDGRGGSVPVRKSAETKVRTVEELARQSEFPLKCVMEKA